MTSHMAVGSPASIFVRSMAPNKPATKLALEEAAVKAWAIT